MDQSPTLPYLTVPIETAWRPYWVVKRVMDVTLALLAVIALAPVMLLVAMLIKLDSRGPVLFKQTRIGRGGQPFTFYKFRSMVHNADPEIHRQYVQSLIRNGAASETEAAGCSPARFKLTRDPRITRVGALLRRTSLDELPQFFNVLKGDMSLVGPRPPIPYEVTEYTEWQCGRLAVTPGITGVWQVMGRSRVPFDQMVQTDLDYIAQQSFWLDCRILWQTIPAVLSGSGAK